MTFNIIKLENHKKLYNSQDRNMFFNSPEKFHKSKIRQCCVEPTIHCIKLQTVKDAKYLGLTISSDLSWNFRSLYTARPSSEYFRQVYFVHSRLQDESLQVTISKLPYGYLTCTEGDFPCTGDIQLTS